MATLRDVARAAGVSPATASRALATPDRVSADRRDRVARAAAELGYRAPRTEHAAEGRRLGVIVPDLQNPFFSGIVKGVQHRARSAGMAVLVADSDEDPHLETELVAQMGPQVDGIVLCSPRMSDQALATLPTNPEIVLVNRESEHLRSVIIDNDDGIRQAVRHLHALGHRRIAYAGGQWGSWSDRERRRALEIAAHDLPEVELVQLGHFPMVFAGGVAAADLVSASGATAVVAHNDLIALGILDRLRSRGVDVPGQVSVVGFDDVPTATHVSPTLTTVAVPLRQLGRTAVELLLEAETSVGAGPATDRGEPDLEPEGVLVVPVSLVVRDSTTVTAPRERHRPGHGPTDPTAASPGAP
ncbi:LacI family DNA-binding transcriptional regulator [Actinotalea sp. BY-33]|uniref:LacI family DNA-binding transcriptional regulator n=1 Tax=Actinotalea soli TaxID=2819234 RepID=A0A939LT00_9CELL|nr:LacI family DNA-binding transcriptional regulator [Actinotalea soli]MBO1752480.1 LacI family DNA-binding transcriptional regulator [Actinotalea soli]